ncbi:MAG: putative FAD-dependent pyridine nucleotide-disulfide oxidoreductase [Burkholderia sp.]|nr:putative FAD-dependent pyridine nucleotide-disulfide oxidoreductase [Burkholderia sp.]
MGAGQAGGWVAKTLIDEGFDGEVVLLGDEPYPPYERPPLSKDLLLGKVGLESTYLWAEELPITARYGNRVVRIDRAGSKIFLESGEVLGYDKLVIATGARVRQIDLPGAHYLRTINDALALHDKLKNGGPVQVVGGGWIGLEVAAAAREFGCSVTLVESASRLCSRAAPEVLAQYLHDLHRRNGVEVRLGHPAKEAEGALVVGVGIVPNDELAADAGLHINGGIVVDEFCRTSDSNIYAAGDVAVLNGVRRESWLNAQNQAIAAARSLLGKGKPYQELPWFWSDQYGVNIQLLGIAHPKHRVVVRGSFENDRFVIFFLSEERRLAAVIAANSGRDVRVARRLIELGSPLQEEMLADANVPLQKILSQLTS